jgi:hypothetical protein
VNEWITLNEWRGDGARLIKEEYERMLRIDEATKEGNKEKWRELTRRSALVWMRLLDEVGRQLQARGKTQRAEEVREEEEEEERGAENDQENSSSEEEEGERQGRRNLEEAKRPRERSGSKESISSDDTTTESIRSKAEQAQEPRKPVRRVTATASRTSSALDERAEDQDRYERFELVINKRKMKGRKGWEWVEKETGKIKKIEIREKGGGGKKVETERKLREENSPANRISDAKRIEELYKRSMGIQKMGAGHYKIKENTNAFRLRVRIIITSPGVTLAFIDKVVGELKVRWNRADSANFINLSRGHGVMVVFEEGEVDTLIRASNGILRFEEYVHVDPRLDYTTIKVRFDEGKIKEKREGNSKKEITNQKKRYEET